MPPAVSVNICCYNGERYLTEALQSVFFQTFKDWEIVVVDDGSTDSSAAIIQRNIKDGWPIVYHWQENAGLGNARNKCLELSSGRFIGFLDQDDLWLEDKLERQVKVMEGTAAALCYGGVININSAGNRIGVDIPRKASGMLFEPLLMQFDIHLPTAFVRRAALERSGLSFDGNVRASEEYCLFMQLAVNNEFIVIQDALAKYRIHDGALTNRSISRWAKEREYTLDLIKKDHPGIESRYQAGFQEAYARARYYRARQLVVEGKRREARREMRKNATIDLRYFFLHLILFLPSAVWNFLHAIRSRRLHYG